MLPQVWCREHKEVAKAKKLYDLAEVDPKSGLTSLQMFVRANKGVFGPTAGGDVGYALLRRAKRYDSLMNEAAVVVNKSLTGKRGRSSAVRGVRRGSRRSGGRFRRSRG